MERQPEQGQGESFSHRQVRGAAAADPPNSLEAGCSVSGGSHPPRLDARREAGRCGRHDGDRHRMQDDAGSVTSGCDLTPGKSRRPIPSAREVAHHGRPPPTS